MTARVEGHSRVAAVSPAVSVVIPCHGQAEFLAEAVTSVVAQTFGNWEIVIVDDGSPDDTAAVAAGLIAGHPDRRIRLVRQPNAGLAAARNAGIAASTGRYILPLDADDVLMPEMLARTVALLDAEPAVAIAYTDQQQFGTVDRVVRLVEWDPELLRRRNIFAATALYRREVWQAVGGYDPEMREGYEDWDFWIGAAESGFEARRLPEPLFGYRIRASSMHSTAREQRHRELTNRIRRKHPRTYRHPWRHWRRWPGRLLGRIRYLTAGDAPERAMTPDEGAHDLSLLAVHLAQLHGLRAIVGRGRVAWADIALAAPEIERLAIEDTRSGNRSRDTWSHSVLVGEDLTLDGLAWPPDDLMLLDLDPAIPYPLSDSAAARSIGQPGVLVVARPVAPDQLAAALGDAGLEPTFTGFQPAAGGEARAVAIVDQRVNAALTAAPPGFHVLAIMTAFNEEDVIGSTIESLIGSGLDVHLIDNWSTDRTHAIAERFLGRGLVGLERFPATPSATYDWGDLLSRVEEVAAASSSDWFIHHDSDERHLSPWPSRSLRDAIWTVQQSGFNAIDHTVLNFRPVDDGFVAGSDPEAYFRHFEFGTTPDDLHRIKAWRSTGGRVSLAASGGHEVRFPGRTVFPYKFLLKHYPVRSQAHGERKVLRERAARWNAAERARGWHVHYDAVTEGHRFLRSPHELREFDGRTVERELIAIISGVGLAPRPVPRWATRNGLTATTYRLAAAVLRSSLVGRLRRTRLLRASVVRRPGRWVRGHLIGTRQ